MKMKCGKWLADWRDKKGVRHRKALASKSEAQYSAPTTTNPAEVKRGKHGPAMVQDVSRSRVKPLGVSLLE
jgi:hypothetical protein